MARKPTSAQLRVLRALDICSSPGDPADEWGDVYSHYDRANGTPSSLEMRNFDRSAEACKRNGWLTDDDGPAITYEGRAAITGIPACAAEMKCLCAGHARGDAPSAPCNTDEEG